MTKSINLLARDHVTGSSEFIDDRPAWPHEVYLGLVLSEKARAKVREIDFKDASCDPDFITAFTSHDLRHNKWGTIFEDQPLLAHQDVFYVGEVLAIVVCRSRHGVRRCTQKVQVTYEDLKPILTIKDAVKKKSYIGPCRVICRGNPDQGLKNAPFTMKGCLRLDGQEHFYLEPHTAWACPVDNNSLEVYSSSQHPTEVQHLVAKALGLGHHQVQVTVRRMGGAFGGKESQAAPFAVYAALVAWHLKRPARIVVHRDDDMLMTGKRNPFENHYEVGFDEQGKIMALKAQFYSDGGAYADLSTAIMERAMLHIDNAYFIEHLEVKGQVCLTHHTPHTAFRGFGGPKGVLTIESIIEDIAAYLDLDSSEVRQRNFYRPGYCTTHYGQKVLPLHFETLQLQLKDKVNYAKRRHCINEYNAANQSNIRGMALTPVKFGIAFTTRFLNQGCALVNLHKDGSVQVSTGATEMGQGVYHKIAVVVSECLGIPVEKVRHMPTSTEKNHNTSPTAASSGSDINAAAALQACEVIKKRLCLVAEQVFRRPENLRGAAVAGAGTAPEIIIDETRAAPTYVFEKERVFDPQNKKHSISLCELISEAYLNRVSLGAYGFFRYDGIHFNKETGEGEPFYYFTTGMACSEVSICRYTGEVKLLRADILMDLGRPIHEGIDLGQVVGGFVQGLGWVTTERLRYDDHGALLSLGPSRYKIPSIHDVAREINVELVAATPQGEEKNVRGSKAVGEPPLLLAASVWAACKNALYYLAPPKELVKLDCPASAERLLLEMQRLDKAFMRLS